RRSTHPEALSFTSNRRVPEVCLTSNLCSTDCLPARVRGANVGFTARTVSCCDSDGGFCAAAATLAVAFTTVVGLLAAATVLVAGLVAAVVWALPLAFWGSPAARAPKTVESARHPTATLPHWDQTLRFIVCSSCQVTTFVVHHLLQSRGDVV